MATGSASPFHNLLHSNYIPTSEEVVKIREWSASPLKELARLEAEINHTHALLYDLQRSYRQLKASVDAHLALLSPMRSLPPEVLQHIFSMTLPLDRNAVMHASEAPVLLGRVCRGWRKITFATPELWRSIHVVCPPSNLADSEFASAQIKAMQEWLARSGACPLSISIRVSEAGYGGLGTAVAAANPFVEAILPLANRWKNIELRVPTDALDSFRYLQGGSDVPLLQTVAITNGGSLARDDCSDSMHTRSASLLFLQRAPRLRSLSLMHEGNVDLPLLPWSQLTVLSLCPTHQFFGLDSKITLILSQCVNLRTCTLHLPPATQGNSIAPGVFSLPHLSFLSVRATNFTSSNGVLADIFDNLLLPSRR
ncbi:hypothetical protein C8R47DRAFT_978600 [Mycena vitilis]|nr:hypothetical protein C8R47DRAFT_978600 [Mycena vitilis]